MKGYKGFEKGLICRDKQYAENTVFEEDNAEICHSGIHFCKNPFDVLDYYNFVNDNSELNEFCEVEALDDVKTDDEKKFCTKKLKIGAKIGITGLIKAFVDFTLENVKAEKNESNTGYQSAATNTGNQSAATVSGSESFAIVTGIGGKAKGALGCYIALAEWVWSDDESQYRLGNFKTHRVDGKTIKPDTFYMLKDGEFIEVAEDEK